MIRAFFVLVLVCQLLALSTGDVEVRIDDLETQVKELREEVTDLSKTIEDLENSLVKRNIADQKLDKAIANVLLNKQDKASMYWREVVNYLVDSSLLTEYLKTLVENTYLGNSDNFYYVLDFLVRNELYKGFPMLFKELEQHREMYSGQEIFALAHKLRAVCGVSNPFYSKIPKVVREILAGPVILKNVRNMGYIIADEDNYACEERSSCYSSGKSQVFIEQVPYSTTLDELKNMSRAHWQFIGPDNVTELALGFFIKNMEKDLFFVFGQRPATTILRANTTFMKYYSIDYHSQFLPALIPQTTPNATTDNENFIRIGVREKMFRKIEYFQGREFQKKMKKVEFSRMPIFQGNMEGFVFEVFPVNGNDIDNAIQGGNPNENCNFTM